MLDSAAAIAPNTQQFPHGVWNFTGVMYGVSSPSFMNLADRSNCFGYSASAASFKAFFLDALSV